ncbi:DNA repair helicase XPB [Brevibacillus centrosporus]|uniref:DNA 3'-5' helicase n=1 Tax=Brevibacillus centrosporus TaxID=54910 RepID=A0A1I3S8Z5_9BACL|nr:DNA repair helicase XPB [Brevibacillus centrosporus]MEC2131884.1 DEAD/DEAH box helicase [Brevibacillus centrosporus]MED1951878.1 DEAD/DEAH box helicase [Brevibacillus centrosporus]MED4909308.1 DEAD/DEAH box helicase [Brevibacillus centrosporus]SFJ55274.1 DNA excision repair protein ERCC-3 [Brevibacillus centrosporus]GED33269.1 DEAD/DEAH box helicase [Brevibacillus centrosporus]
MSYRPDLPMIVQSDRTILLETQHPLFTEARQAISGFAELIKSPEYMHTYRITPLSLWNAAAGGMTPEQVSEALTTYSKYGVPPTIVRELEETMSRYGRIRLEKSGDDILLISDDSLILTELTSYKSVAQLLDESRADEGFIIKPYARGLIKQELIHLGYPVQDIAGYTAGESCPVSWREITAAGRPFALRPYQEEAVRAFHSGGAATGGSGVLVLPCGAGKTVIGLGAICQLQTATLIVTTNTTSVRQWISELLDKTGLDPSLVGEYTGDRKEVKPITVATYQILTFRPSAEDEFPHMKLFSERDWGLIIYDEVHLLPAPVFRVTSGIQATRRLGLTATLVREDGREEDVFTLIGPKKYEVPWKIMEEQGWIAEALCREIRLPFEPKWREAYARASTRQKFRIAAENPRKLEVVRYLLDQHSHDQVLIIGQYVDQLDQMAAALGLPLITGKVPESERELLYQQFKKGEIKRLIVSKVANFAVDLPDANVAIQISGTFGSRQEEAQRLGRILRPKPDDNKAHFYTLVTRDTREQEFSLHRQLFLVEQGYPYDIIEMETLV